MTNEIVFVFSFLDETYFNARYQEKKWVSEDVQPINMISGRHSNCDKPTEGGVRIPRKARKYSLEEEILDTNMSQVASTTRPRWVISIHFFF